MVEQVVRTLKRQNEKGYGKGKVLRFYDSQPVAETNKK